MELNTQVAVLEGYKGRLGNLILQDAKFFGRPNFSGELDNFNDDRRKFTVLIPNEHADELRSLGWNVKTTLPQTEEQDPVSHLKVMVDRGSSVLLIAQGLDGVDKQEVLSEDTFGIVDRSRVLEMDMEIRAWEYDEGQYSARLVSAAIRIQPNFMQQKYGHF